jgi:anti-sigma regulatory factor (Ser/Thr protein kinase)
VDVDVPRDRVAPRFARAALRGWLDGALAPGQLSDAETIVSELVSNALVHGRGDIRLRLDLQGEPTGRAGLSRG